MTIDRVRFRLVVFQFAKFIATGVLNTCVGLGMIWLCWRWIGLSTVVSNFVGYCVGLCVSFAINRSWTFRSERSIASALPRFLLVFVAAYLANLATVLLLTDRFGVRVEWATLVATVPYTLTFFFGSRWFVFERSASDHGADWKAARRVVP